MSDQRLGADHILHVPYLKLELTNRIDKRLLNTWVLEQGMLSTLPPLHPGVKWAPDKMQ